MMVHVQQTRLDASATGRSNLNVGTPIIEGVANADKLLAATCEVREDLMVLDWDICKDTVSHLLKALRQVCPKLFVVGLAASRQHEWSALLAGVDIFLCKADPAERLIAVAGIGRDR